MNDKKKIFQSLEDSIETEATMQKGGDLSMLLGRN